MIHLFQNPRNELEKLRLDLSNWIENRVADGKEKILIKCQKKLVINLASALWYAYSRSIKNIRSKIEIFSEFFGRSPPENYNQSLVQSN